MSHLSAETFVDVLDGTLGESDLPHLQTCAECRAQLAELRQTMAMAAEADVPEPSPLFWQHMAARVRESVAAEPVPGAASGLIARLLPAGFSWWGMGGLVGVAAAALLVVVVQTPRGSMTPADTPAPAQVLNTGDAEPIEAAPAFESDETLTFVTDLASGVDWDASADSGLASSVGIERSVATLNADERAELGRLLTDALRGGA